MNNYISKYCIIRNNSVNIDGDILFRDEESDTYKDFIKKLYRHYQIGYPKFFKMDNLSKLGFINAELLLKETKYPGNERNDRLGLILSNSVSSIDADQKHQESISDRNNYFPSPSVFVYTLPNIMIGEISIKHKIHGESMFFVSEQPDFDFMETYINELIRDEIINACIYGWVNYESDQYESALFLIEKTDNPLKSTIFDSENLKHIFYKTER